MPGFDPRNRERTLADRGLACLDTLVLFDGRAILTAPSDRNDEERYKSVALGDDGKAYAVIWTWRDADIWVISFRRAHNDEARRYFNHVGRGGESEDPARRKPERDD